ncbi:alpha/beta hydrolase [Streptomyces sp. NPDC005408]|uniref:alpha/beta fold hydrolase n=1 Tax=Streptomyces sp. NPDC005408 TaxID=3155341 RepID=UPI0033B66090
MSGGTRPAVLWLHGYTMDSTTWEPLWELLPGFRHIGVDLPGHGTAEPIPAGLTLPALAARIADRARAEGTERMVALSYGSSVALQIAVDHPDVTERLVLAAPTLAGAPPEPHARRRYQQLAMAKRITGPGEQLADLWMASPPDIFNGTERHPRLRAALREVIRKHSWAELDDGSMNALTAHHHSREDLRRIRARTLVVIGDEDMPTFRRNARWLAEDVAECEVLSLPETGHLPLLERPEAVAGALARHLA